MLALLTPAAALAHSAAPSVLSVLATQPTPEGSARPALLTLTVGAASLQRNSVYTYRCPAAWGGEDRVLQAATPDAALHGVLAGSAVLLAAGGCAYMPVPLPPGLTPVDLIALGADRLALLTVSAKEASVLVLGASSPPESIGTWPLQGDDGLVPDGLLDGGDSVYIAGSRPTPGLLRLRLDGSRHLARLDLSPAPQVLLPRLALPSGVLLSSRHSDGVDLLRATPQADSWSPTTLVSGAQKLLGPVSDGAHALAVIDGKLTRIDGAEPEVITEVPYTCLSAVQGQLFACRLGDVAALTWNEGAPPSEQPAFRLTDLRAPEAACGQSEAEQEACAGDWSHFGAEAGLLDLSEPAPPTEAKESGCAAGRGNNTEGSWMAMGVLVGLGVYRNRRRLRLPG